MKHQTNIKLFFCFQLQILIFDFVAVAHSTDEWTKCNKKSIEIFNNTNQFEVEKIINICCQSIMACRCLKKICCQNNQCNDDWVVHCGTLVSRCQQISDDDQYAIKCQRHRPDEVANEMEKPDCGDLSSTKIYFDTNSSSNSSSSTNQTITIKNNSKIWFFIIIILVVIVVIIIIVIVIIKTNGFARKAPKFVSTQANNNENQQ